MEKFRSERTATLQRKQGENLGFKLRRATEDGAQFRLVEDLPTLHRLIEVVENGHAYKAGLREDDRLIEINGHDVRSRSYLECAQLLRNTGERLTLKVIRLSEKNIVDAPVPLSIEPQFEDEVLTNHIPDFLKANRCIYTIKDTYNNPSIIRSFEILKPHCATPEGPLHPTFNTIVDRSLDINILSSILSDATSPASGLTPYIVDSLKRYHSLRDIIILLPEVPNILSDSQYEALVDQLSKRMLLVQALESLSYDSQRFLCNFIRKNDLPIPLSYRIWNATDKIMSYRVNFNCLMETLCVTDLRLLLQFGSPSASGLGKSSLIGYLFADKRRESFFTEASDRSWRDGCMDVLFTDRYVIFDTHGRATHMKLIRAIQSYSSVQLIYLTEEDLQGDFVETNVFSNTQTIAVVFDANYDNLTASAQLLKRFEERFKQLTNVCWTSAPMLNARTDLSTRQITQRNKRLRETFEQLLLKQVQSNTGRSVFRSCFQIQSSFYQRNTSPTPIDLFFEVEKELDRLFSSLSDQTENLLLATPVSYQRSRMGSSDPTRSERSHSTSNAIKEFSRSIQVPSVVNDYHTFTISLLTQRTYLELLITEIYLEKWRATYVPKLREEQEDLREKASTVLRQLKQAERENGTSSEVNNFRRQYEELRTRLREIDNRLMNVDLTVGLLCDELFALWDNIYVTHSTTKIEQLQSTFELVATKLAGLVYKGFALHILRSRPLQSHSRLLRMCMGKLELRDSVAILTVIGEQSSAKSSLLNSTFGCNFRVSAGRCTIGLYLGIAYYKNTTIMILDTEGLMSLEESGSIFDNQIVTMAVLSSNLVIVNHKGEISSSLEGLIGMSLYAKIQIQSSPFKPKLLFVLRDQTQRDMKIFQQQLNRLKENIQTNGEFLQVSIDDELEIKHVVLMPGAFTEDINRDYGIVQKWRTETFAMEINGLRTTVFNSLEAQMSETVNTITLRKNLDTYLYSKLTTTWKSIDDLGQGLLRCQSLYELSVENELKYLCAMIIAERHSSLQKRSNELIETLVRTNNDLEASGGLRPHDWIQQMVKKGIKDLKELINEEIEVAKSAYAEQTQRSCFTKVKDQWKNIESSIKNMQQYFYEQLEIRTLETALQTNRDYYRRELFLMKEKGKTPKESIEHLDRRVKELESEITNNLKTYKRNKDDLIKSTLDVYKNVIETKTTDNRRRSTYNLCPPLGYSKYMKIVQKLDQVINKYVNQFLRPSDQENALPNAIELPTPSITAMASPFSFSKQDDRSVLQWFTNADDLCRNERTLHFIFSELLPLISDRLDMSPLHVAYSDPKMMDELIELIDYGLQSTKIDIGHINRPALVQDLIIFTLHLLGEKTNQRFQLQYERLLNESLIALHQVQQNVREQIEEEERTGNQGKLFRRILGKEIIREVERINRQKLIAEIHMKLNQNFAIDPMEITRHIYKESIASETIDPTAILKLVYDPIHFCFEQIHSTVQGLVQQFTQVYMDETNTTVAVFMLSMRDIILDDACVDAHALHKSILREIVSILPGFQASRTIEVERKITDPRLFKEYFVNLNLFDGESDAVLLEQLAKVREDFRGMVLGEHFDTLIYRSIGCQARCPGCGLKCELPAKSDPSEEHHHSSQHHLPMAFHGWPRNKDLHPNLSMCYQQWTKKILFREENFFSTPKEFFSSEAPDWYEDLREKSEKGEAHAELYPLEEHRRAWMAVRSKLLQEFDLRDQESYHSGVYPTTIVSIPNDFFLLWKSL